MHEDTTEPFALPAVAGKKVTAAFDGGRITSDGGVILLARAEHYRRQMRAGHLGCLQLGIGYGSTDAYFGWMSELDVRRIWDRRDDAARGLR